MMIGYFQKQTIDDIYPLCVTWREKALSADVWTDKGEEASMCLKDFSADIWEFLFPLPTITDTEQSSVLFLKHHSYLL